MRLQCAIALGIWGNCVYASVEVPEAKENAPDEAVDPLTGAKQHHNGDDPAFEDAPVTSSWGLASELFARVGSHVGKGLSIATDVARQAGIATARGCRRLAITGVNAVNGCPVWDHPTLVKLVDSVLSDLNRLIGFCERTDSLKHNIEYLQTLRGVFKAIHNFEPELGPSWKYEDLTELATKFGGATSQLNGLKTPDLDTGIKLIMGMFPRDLITKFMSLVAANGKKPSAVVVESLDPVVKRETDLPSSIAAVHKISADLAQVIAQFEAKGGDHIGQAIRGLEGLADNRVILSALRESGIVRHFQAFMGRVFGEVLKVNQRVIVRVIVRAKALVPLFSLFSKTFNLELSEEGMAALNFVKYSQPSVLTVRAINSPPW